MGLHVVNCSLSFISDLSLWGKGRGQRVTGWLRGLAGTVTSQKDSLESPSPLSSTHTPEGPLQPHPRHEPLPPGLCGLLSPAGR